MYQEIKTKTVTPEMLFCDGIAADDQNVWMLLVEHNILMRIDRKTGIMVPCGYIASERKEKNPQILYRFLFLHEEKLILLPYDEKDICIYNIQEAAFEHIELDMEKLGKKDTWRFTGYKKSDNRVVVYGENSLILIIDLSTFEIRYLDLSEKIPEDLKIDYWFWKYSYIKENKIYLVPLLSDPCVIELDMCSEDVKCYRIPEENIGPIDNPVFDEASLFYFHRNQEKTVKLSRFDLGSENVEVYDLNIENIKDGKAFSFVACVQGVLWMLPGICEDAYKFHTSEGRLEKVSGLPTVSSGMLNINFPYEFNYRNGLLTEKGHILTMHAWSCQLVDLDTNSGNIKVIPILRNDSAEWSRLFNELLDHTDGGMCREWISGMVETYLDREDGKKKTEGNESTNSIGTMIYNSI